MMITLGDTIPMYISAGRGGGSFLIPTGTSSSPSPVLSQANQPALPPTNVVGVDNPQFTVGVVSGSGLPTPQTVVSNFTPVNMPAVIAQNQAIFDQITQAAATNPNISMYNQGPLYTPIPTAGSTPQVSVSPTGQVSVTNTNNNTVSVPSGETPTLVNSQGTQTGTTPSSTGNPVSDWISQNSTLALAGGAVLVLLLLGGSR